LLDCAYKQQLTLEVNPGCFTTILVKIYPVVFEKKIFKDIAYKPCGWQYGHDFNNFVDAS
jgi:hypothetical protein